jgi:integrase
MAHMQDGWIQLNGQRPEIHVPLAEDCSIGTGTGRGGDTTKGGKSCSICRNRAEKDWAPDGADWTPKSENGNRTIPVRDEDTIRILKNYFKIHDNVCGQNTVTSRVKSIADRAGLERKVTPHDLRDTYGTRLALKGFSPYDIRDLMGHANLEQALDYIKLSGAQVHRQYDDLW